MIQIELLLILQGILEALYNLLFWQIYRQRHPIIMQSRHIQCKYHLSVTHHHSAFCTVQHQDVTVPVNCSNAPLVLVFLSPPFNNAAPTLKSGAQPHESLASQFKPGLSHLSLHSCNHPHPHDPLLSNFLPSLQVKYIPADQVPDRKQLRNRLFQDLSTGLLVMPCNQLGRKFTLSSRPSSDTQPMLAPPGWLTFSLAVLALLLLTTSTN